MCSEPLERAIVDFGADIPFGRISQKLKEHYGIEISASTARRVVYKHAENISENPKKYWNNKENIANCIIGSIDGVMVPIVEIDQDKNEKDSRKARSTCWKEARLACGYRKGSVSPNYAATIGSTDQAGGLLKDCITREGLGKKTDIHIVADGAPWIEDQVEKLFGGRANFLIDFYHASQYLAEASKCCFPETSEEWLKLSQGRIKKNNIEQILLDLKAHIEKECGMGKDCPARKCLNYLEKRITHLDYESALKQGLPIGSGTIESANRHVIQARLKGSGIWWKKENIQPMLDLRVLRANGDWSSYWQSESLRGL